MCYILILHIDYTPYPSPLILATSVAVPTQANITCMHICKQNVQPQFGSKIQKNILKTTDLPFYTWLVASVRTLLGKYNVATMVLLAHFRLITAILLKK